MHPSLLHRLLRLNVCVFVTIALLCVTRSANGATPLSVHSVAVQTHAATLTSASLSEYRIDSEQITVQLPRRAIAGSATDAQGTTRTRIAREDELWLITITVIDGQNPLTTAADILFDLIASRRAQFPNAPNVERKPLEGLEIDGQPVQAVSLVLTTLDDPPRKLESRFAVRKLEGSTFMIVQIDSPVGGESPGLDAFLEGIDLSERTASRESLREARLRGKAFLDTIDQATLEAALPSEPIVYRIYIPGSSSASGQDEEIGYQRLEIRRGFRGEMKPDTPRDRWREDDNQPGIFARIETRLLSDDVVVDTRELHFLSMDRELELGEIVAVTKSGRTSAGSTTTLIRRGNRITVQHEDGMEPPTTRDWNLGDRGGGGYYLSRLEVFLLGGLVAKAARDAADFGEGIDAAFYAYDAATRRLTTRTDRIERRGSGWRHISAPTIETEDADATLNSRGEMLRRVLPNGIVFEQMPIAEIRRLWERKGLPIRTEQ